MSRLSRLIVLSVAIAGSSFVISAQTQQAPKSGEPQKQGGQGSKDKDYVISVDTTLIQVPVSVHDKEGRPVNNLTKDQFQVLEDKIPQLIKLFVHEDVP